MIRINENYRKLQASYLFSDIAKRVAAHQQANPDQQLIKLGLHPLPRNLLVYIVQVFLRHPL